jgi:hypothetical protein
MLVKNKKGFIVIAATIVPIQKEKQSSQSIGFILLNGSTFNSMFSIVEYFSNRL